MRNKKNNELTIIKWDKKEIKQYKKLIALERSKKYNSLGDMKKQLFNMISTYSDEELDFLKEWCKDKISRADKATTGYIPVWTAIVITMINVLNAFSFWVFILLLLIIILEIVTSLSNMGIVRISYFTILLDLVEKVEEIRGHSFNDSLAEELNISNR